jgi:DNA-binding IclR family transcriptional regulator
MGKALLAFAPAGEVRRVLARRLTSYTPMTVTTSEDLNEVLAMVRGRRIAVAPHEFSSDEWAIAAPIFGQNGVIASIEVVGTGSVPAISTLTPVLSYASRAVSAENRVTGSDQHLSAGQPSPSPSRATPA